MILNFFQNRIRQFFLLVCLAIVLAISNAIEVSAIPTKAEQALIVEFNTGKVLLAKNAETPMHPASMTKIMTAYMIFDRLKEGLLSLDTRFRVSRNAWRKRGSKMFLRENKYVRIEDLIRGIIVQSGNDASIAVAEGISGNEEDFARDMTLKAREIGMANTTFKNASGWPDAQHLTTAHDLATLIESTIKEYPEFYHYYSEKEFTYANIRQYNRNPLLRLNTGVDGLKTGHTDVAGYGLAASAIREGRRLVLVINGLKTGPIAENTLDANDQHYEVPANYFKSVLGPRLKYSCCWFDNNQSTLEEAEIKMMEQTEKFEDELEIISSVLTKTKTSFTMKQIIKKHEELISEATVQLVTVNKEGKPIKIPEILNNLLN